MNQGQNSRALPPWPGWEGGSEAEQNGEAPTGYTALKLGFQSRTQLVCSVSLNVPQISKLE